MAACCIEDHFLTTSGVGLMARSSFFKVVGSPVGSTIPLNKLIFIFLCLIILSVAFCFTQHRFVLLWDQGIFFIHSTVMPYNQSFDIVLWLILSIIYSYLYQIKCAPLVHIFHVFYAPYILFYIFFKSAPLVDTLVTIEW